MNMHVAFVFCDSLFTKEWRSLAVKGWTTFSSAAKTRSSRLKNLIIRLKTDSLKILNEIVKLLHTNQSYFSFDWTFYQLTDCFCLFQDVDYVCISDNYWLGKKKPCVTYGLRWVSVLPKTKVPRYSLALCHVRIIFVIEAFAISTLKYHAQARTSTRAFLAAPCKSNYQFIVRYKRLHMRFMIVMK